MIYVCKDKMKFIDHEITAAQVVFVISLIMRFHFKNIGIDHSYWVFNQNGSNNTWMQWYWIKYPVHCFSEGDQ